MNDKPTVNIPSQTGVELPTAGPPPPGSDTSPRAPEGVAALVGPPATEEPDAVAASVPSLLGSIVVGLAALGWVALWFIDRGECEREGIVLTCNNGSLEIEINLLYSASLAVFGALAILRGVLGIALRATGATSRADSTPPPPQPPAAPSAAPVPPAASAQEPTTFAATPAETPSPPAPQPPPPTPSQPASPSQPAERAAQPSPPSPAPPQRVDSDPPATGPQSRATAERDPIPDEPTPSSGSDEPDDPDDPETKTTTRWHRQPLLWVILALVTAGGIIAAIVAQGGSSTAEPRSGVYSGRSDDGFMIVFTVREGDDAISSMTVDVTCGSVGRRENITFTPGLPVDDGVFSVTSSAQAAFGVDGRFGGDGTEASGDWSVGSCSGRWAAELSDVAPDVVAEELAPEEPPAAPAPPTEVEQVPAASESTTSPSTTAPSTIEAFQDQFDGALDVGWDWVFEDPDLWSLSATPGWLQMTAAVGAENNVLVRDEPQHPYEITTAVRFHPTSNFQFAGLVVAESETDFLQFGLEYCSSEYDSCIGRGVYLEILQDGEWLPASTLELATNLDVVYLRLVVDGDSYAGYVSEDGSAWTFVGERTRSFTDTKIGLAALGATEEPAVAEFDYVTVTSP